jgi:hypothetical protein
MFLKSLVKLFFGNIRRLHKPILKVWALGSQFFKSQITAQITVDSFTNPSMTNSHKTLNPKPGQRFMKIPLNNTRSCYRYKTRPELYENPPSLRHLHDGALMVPRTTNTN